MRRLIAVLLLVAAYSAFAKEATLTISLNDVFTINEHPGWSIKIERYMPLRLADVLMFSQKGYAFDMKLFFKCDTKDLASFDSPDKLRATILLSSKKYLPYCVEDKVTLKKLEVKRFGFYTQLTDKELVNKKIVPKGQYRYLTRGFYRVGDDSVLGFSLMTNDIESKDYKLLLDYILNFEK